VEHQSNPKIRGVAQIVKKGKGKEVGSTQYGVPKGAKGVAEKKSLGNEGRSEGFQGKGKIRW